MAQDTEHRGLAATAGFFREPQLERKNNSRVVTIADVQTTLVKPLGTGIEQLKKLDSLRQGADPKVTEALQLMTQCYQQAKGISEVPSLESTATNDESAENRSGPRI
ncbi:hypothetical protein [Legionella spiritensis]|uniref:hypothetical protein n=1 Tax=Legionella spiritensis TaxID=452 RepID=UPI000F6F0552|nr:hypothetical protein [Legionella spiritensis]VEG90796.1 Uncharacterised protein [Legionella spiritensis]